ncbi:MAG: hypothetical protein JWR72_799 [Flavisolibacter sp.]|jgi:hypothetical protein|nr:hypothetical protein [Flavisolibacter sp.]
MENIAEPNKAIEADIDREIANRTKDIPGWGIDADIKNNPTYPMKHYNGADHERFNYEKPPQQPIDVEILHSIERPGVTRVFGTSTPPSGLSGMLRRYAFRYSESTYAHWVPLVVADRINVIEGIVDDLKHGHIPNIFAEKGWQAEWKYNRQGFIKNVAVTVAVTAVVATLLFRKKKSK